MAEGAVVVRVVEGLGVFFWGRGGVVVGHGFVVAVGGAIAGGCG